MDIRKLAVEQTARLHLRDASDELIFTEDTPPKAVVVIVYGPGSKQYAKAQAAQQNRLVEKLRRKGKADQTAEQLMQEKAGFLADCTASFENLELDKLTGDALAVAVYSDPTIGFIADQVAKHISEWANFTKGSTTS